ncbi:hypothetical protein V2G26_015050 [Clonostachys chloroleuca]
MEHQPKHESENQPDYHPEHRSEQSQQADARYSAQPPSAEDILEAAKCADKDQLLPLLAQYGAYINIKSEDGLTALHLAILSRDLGAVETLLELGSDIEAQAPGETWPLLMATKLGDVDMVTTLLKHSGNSAPNYLGIQPLSRAILDGDIELARLLIDYGIETYGEDFDLNELLSDAVLISPSHVGTIKLLLDRGADPDWFYNNFATVLHSASAKGDLETMEALLDAGAKVDIRDFNGATPLFEAVALDDLAPARLLLQHGANTHIWNSNGKSVIDLAESNPEMLELLQADTVFQGPRMKSNMNEQPKESFTMLRPALPPTWGERAKLVACHGFDATIIDFFIGGEREQMIPKRASVHELLYSHGPEAIRSRLDNRRPDFTWYHLPSNNMVWVETLIRRLAAEKGAVSKEMYEDTKEELELSHFENQKSRSSAGPPSTLRPQCRRVLSHIVTSIEDGSDDCVVSFVPFLHAETYSGYEHMAKAMKRSWKHKRGRFVNRPEAGHRPGHSFEKPTSPRTRKGLLGHVKSGWVELREMLIGRPVNLRPDTESSGIFSNGQNLSGGVEINRSTANVQVIEYGNEERGASAMAAYPPGFPAKISTELDREMVNTFQDERLSIRSNDKGSDKAASQNPKSPTWETNKPATPESQKIIDDNGNASRPNKSVSAIEPGQISPRANRQLDAAGTRKTQKERIPPPTKNLNEHLIRGYYKPGTVGVQPRRTLDQYIYADMETLTHRDDDQVVYRYTKENLSVGPKIFMVDQLWLWILGKDTIITCSPLQWNSWIPRGFTLRPHQMYHTAEPGLLAFISGAQNTRPRHQWASKAKHKSHKFSSRAARRNVHDPDVETWPEINPDDPMNVHQRFTKYLFRNSRGPVGSVYGLAGLITTSCVDVFDPSKLPEDYLFFDFFEQSIGIVNDKVASHLRDFKDTLSKLRVDAVEHVVMDITGETELMIEIEDILDELHILKMVLKDQESVIEDMNKSLREMAGDNQKSPAVETRVLENHLLRIMRMEEAARKADTSIHRLMDLKQKQASLAESWYARAAARDTARQGKTVIVFTVVTILFLPVSFITSVFTIEANTFPRDQDDRIPFEYAMKYILGIGLGLSLPLIIVAFNVDKIADFFNNVRRESSISWKRLMTVTVLVGIVAAIIAPIWTSTLSHGAKIAVTVMLTLFILVALIAKGIWKLFTSAEELSAAASITSGYNSS